MSLRNQDLEKVVKALNKYRDLYGPLMEDDTDINAALDNPR